MGEAIASFRKCIDVAEKQLRIRKKPEEEEEENPRPS
ncbi:MAG: hypothetical protein Ct9H300mP3_05700 [Gammaproteobacteria bacterium]|nr:MAG: hypothetical protein Ct9H300mP3_05700 [Gammaproteobacteria bacterium]